LNHVDSRVFTRNVTEGRTDAWTDGRTVALLYPFHKFVGEGITMYKVWSKSIEGCDVDSRVFTRMLLGKHLTLWPWKSIGFQISLRTKYVPCLVKIHWNMLILECSQGCYRVKIRPCDLDLWSWKSIGFQTLLRTKYVPSLVKIH
jgi:hypothetical protein